jgi:hypothetical protein
MEMYGLPAGLLRTAFVVLAVIAFLERDHIALSTALILLAVIGFLGLELPPTSRGKQVTMA